MWMETENKQTTARVNHPHRHQVSMQFLSLDQMLPENHVARTLGAYVKTLDTSALYQQITVSSTQAGRTATNPEVLLTLWLLATVEGINSARELERRCQRDMPYMWVCGEVSVNRSTLSEFRVYAGPFLNEMLVNTITGLIDSGVVGYEIVAQDGMRVRASAGKSSFRRAPTLNKLRSEVKAFIEKLERQEDENDDDQGSPQSQAAKKRSAEAQLQRLNESLEQIEDLSQRRERRRKGSGVESRCSTTDPDARNMKMANGGFNPALNVQFSSDSKARMIVGVDVTNEGTDGGQLEPMANQLASDYGRPPEKIVTDSAYATKQGVTAVEKQGSQVVATVPREEQLAKHGKNAHKRQPGDTDEYVAFRTRMTQPENIQLCKQRPSVAEFPNAVCRNRNLQQFNVRGLVKMKAVALWHAVAFNFTRMVCLGVIG
jgi:transposase